MDIMLDRSVSWFDTIFKETVANFRSFFAKSSKAEEYVYANVSDLELIMEMNPLASTTKGVGKLPPFLDFKKVKKKLRISTFYSVDTDLISCFL